MNRPIKFRGKRVDNGDMNEKQKATQLYRRTPKGVLTNIYNKQIERSRRKSFLPPSYNLGELHSKYLDDIKYIRLFNEWVNSGYSKDKKPSIDRIDCQKPYTLNNIQIMTWSENRYKQRMESQIFRATKIGKYDLQGMLIAEYASVSDAVKKTGFSQGCISSCLTGHLKTYKRFIWRYLEIPKRIDIIIEKQCARCGKKLISKNKKQKFCSAHCGSIGNNNARKTNIHDNKNLLK